uniref:Uncharacterized protein n=1 Tax=Leuconostoc citreum TaxID=33964 RepID=A0A098DN18_LEUCI|nr:Putative uncharacterized protein [Leuconostoc citreum]
MQDFLPNDAKSAKIWRANCVQRAHVSEV